VTRLELIMTPMDKADASERLSEYIDGTLSIAEHSEVNGWLVKDAALAAERDRLVQTIALLQQLPLPEGPNLVAAVRQRLATEKSTVVTAPPITKSRLSLWMPRVQGLAAGLAMAAGIGGIAVLSTQHNAPTQVSAAGITEEVQARATMVVVGVDLATVAHVAAAMNLQTELSDHQVVVRGSQRTIAQLVLQVKADAAQRGATIAGLLPQAERIELTFIDQQPAR
jgi:anti-sigma factor RsiW